LEITARELKKLNPDDVRIIDIRSEYEHAYGVIDGSLCVSDESVADEIPVDEKLNVIVCRRGVVSQDVAEMLCEEGYKAASLEGGYNAWIVEEMQQKEASAVCAKAEQSLRKTYRKQIWNNFTKALKTYDMLQEGDRVAVCISGGKDSMLLAKLFQELKRHSDFSFDVEFLVMDPGYSKENRAIIERNTFLLGIPVHFFESDIFGSVVNVEKSPCYLCARMRRGYLYTFAKELGCNKIALGHHYDDVIETILMSMLYGGMIQTMMPKLKSTNYEGMELIRPLYFVREDDIKRWRDFNGLHFLQCACKFTENCTSCGENGQTGKRLEAKNLIRQLKKTNPDIEAHIFSSMENVNTDAVICFKNKGIKHNFLEDY